MRPVKKALTNIHSRLTRYDIRAKMCPKHLHLDVGISVSLLGCFTVKLSIYI